MNIYIVLGWIGFLKYIIPNIGNEKTARARSITQ
jgi:hypothetical protein